MLDRLFGNADECGSERQKNTAIRHRDRQRKTLPVNVPDLSSGKSRDLAGKAVGSVEYLNFHRSLSGFSAGLPGDRRPQYNQGRCR